MLCVFAASCGKKRRNYCSSSNECSTGMICKNGDCQYCTEDSDCGEGKSCVDDACQDVERCKNGTCSGGKICVGEFCVHCNRHSDCPLDKACVKGLCEIVKCKDQTDCLNGQVCVKGECTVPKPECKDSRDCKADQACHDKKCVDSTKCTCTSDSECRGYICDCDCRKCESDLECGQDKFCGERGICHVDWTQCEGCGVIYKDAKGQRVCDRCGCMPSGAECDKDCMCYSGVCVFDSEQGKKVCSHCRNNKECGTEDYHYCSSSATCRIDERRVIP